jgi:hypothetical protein
LVLLLSPLPSGAHDGIDCEKVNQDLLRELHTLRTGTGEPLHRCQLNLAAPANGGVCEHTYTDINQQLDKIDAKAEEACNLIRQARDQKSECENGQTACFQAAAPKFQEASAKLSDAASLVSQAKFSVEIRRDENRAVAKHYGEFLRRAGKQKALEPALRQTNPSEDPWAQLDPFSRKLFNTDPQSALRANKLENSSGEEVAANKERIRSFIENGGTEASLSTIALLPQEQLRAELHARNFIAAAGLAADELLVRAGRLDKVSKRMIVAGEKLAPPAVTEKKSTSYTVNVDTNVAPPARNSDIHLALNTLLAPAQALAQATLDPKKGAVLALAGGALMAARRGSNITLDRDYGAPVKMAVANGDRQLMRVTDKELAADPSSYPASSPASPARASAAQEAAKAAAQDPAKPVVASPVGDTAAARAPASKEESERHPAVENRPPVISPESLAAPLEYTLGASREPAKKEEKKNEPAKTGPREALSAYNSGAGSGDLFAATARDRLREMLRRRTAGEKSNAGDEDNAGQQTVADVLQNTSAAPLSAFSGEGEMLQESFQSDGDFTPLFRRVHSAHRRFHHWLENDRWPGRPDL